MILVSLMVRQERSDYLIQHRFLFQQEILYLHLPETTVAFTPVEDGYYTVVQWELDGKSYSYDLRGHVAFEHLDRYFVEARYRAQKAE